MRPVVRDLIQVLEQETVQLKELVELLQGDHQRIIQQQIEALEESNRRKEEVVLRFQALERARLQLTHQLGNQVGISPQEVRISNLVPLLGPEGQALEQSAEKLRALVGTFQELVTVGRGFLEQSILGIRSLLALIQSLRSPDPQTYGADGQFQTGTGSEPVAVRREI